MLGRRGRPGSMTTAVGQGWDGSDVDRHLSSTRRGPTPARAREDTPGHSHPAAHDDAALERASSPAREPKVKGVGGAGQEAGRRSLGRRRRWAGVASIQATAPGGSDEPAVAVGSDAATGEPEAADDEGADRPSGALDGQDGAAATTSATRPPPSPQPGPGRGRDRLSIRAVPSARRSHLAGPSPRTSNASTHRLTIANEA